MEIKRMEETVQCVANAFELEGDSNFWRDISSSLITLMPPFSSR
jgi:hypothetical protein